MKNKCQCHASANVNKDTAEHWKESLYILLQNHEQKIVLMLMKQVYFTSYCQQNLQHKRETMTWWQKYQTMPHCNSNGSEKLKP